MSAPTDQRLAARLARLSPQQRAALAGRLAAADGPALRPRPGPRDRFPLGMDQERLWILDQLDPGTTTYTLGYGLRILGDFDQALFTRAADALTQRHELLRCGAESADGRPVLRLHPDRRADLTWTDLTAGGAPGGPEDAERRRQEFIAAQVARPFDLAADPVLRLAVAKVADGDHQIVETMPHSFVDQHSYVQLNDELLEFYRAFAEDREPRLPELPVQFGDWSHWQREHFAGPHGRRHREFWRTFLDGVPEHLALPYDHSPQTGDHAGEHHNFTLDSTVGKAFFDRAREARTTPATAMTAAYAALLYERTGQRDLVIGIPTSTRAEPGADTLIGFLLTSIPLRIRLPEAPTPRDVLAATAAAAAAVADHREVPFGEIVAASAPDRAADRYPLLQTMLVQLDIDGSRALELPGAEVYANAVPEGISTMDLTTAWWRVDDIVYGRIEYRTALFAHATVAALAERLLQLVEQFAYRPDEPLRRPLPPPPAPVASLLGATDPGTRAPDPEARRTLERVTAAWCEVLGTGAAAPDDTFFTSGGTSMLAVRLAHRLRADGFTVALKDVFTRPTPAGLASVLAARLHQAPAAPRPTPPVGPLGPEQEMLLSRGLARVEDFTHSHVLTAAAPLDADRLHRAAQDLVRAHPTLTDTVRGRVLVPGARWHWTAEAPGADPGQIMAAQRAAFDRAEGPLFAVAHLPGTPGEPDRVVLTASHLVVDGMSWTVVISDLADLYQGGAPRAETAGYAEHAAFVRELDPAEHAPYWRDQLAGTGPYRWRRGGANTYEGEQALEVSVPLAPQARGTLLPAALTAVARALRPWAPHEQPSVWLIGLGRDPLPALPDWDPERAVGFYSAAHPFRVPLTGADAADDLRATAAALHLVPDAGKTFGLLGCAADPGLRAEFSAVARPRVVVNHLGELADPVGADSGPFTASAQTAFPGNPDTEREVDVDVAVSVHDGRAVLRWLFNPGAVDEAAVRAAAESAADELARLVAPADRPQDPDRVPGVTGVTEESMERLFARLSRERRERRGATARGTGGRPETPGEEA
ncbi:condensation domain-containing protein [Streptomyces sp. NPDC055966]|uniref:condensation domain-containing protein n=1 Tax=Streptomyces sp. NPDC055966 TaxID=3345669 RepID=UPI0035DBD8E5